MLIIKFILRKIKGFEEKINEKIEENNILREKIRLMNKNLTKKEFKKQLSEYDVKFYCDSFLKPFEIEKTNKYNDLKEKEYPIISVMGNFDKGKSFILSEISGINLPSGYNVTTPWICGVYPETENNKKKEDSEIEYLNALLLDTAGFNTPLNYNIEVQVI